MTTLPLVQLPSATRNEDINHFGLPSIEDWQKMWKAWDLITVSAFRLPLRPHVTDSFHMNG